MTAATLLPSTALSASKGTSLPKAASWDGIWSGISRSGGRTTVKIANGKVTYWTNNGYSRPKATGSAKGTSVILDDNNRAGSGNLHRGDKWNFCLTSA
jgi:hypothetical protein